MAALRRVGGSLGAGREDLFVQLLHFWYSSSTTRASTNFIGILLSGVSTFVLVGTKSRPARIFWPSSLISKS